MKFGKRVDFVRFLKGMLCFGQAFPTAWEERFSSLGGIGRSCRFDLVCLTGSSGQRLAMRERNTDAYAEAVPSWDWTPFDCMEEECTVFFESLDDFASFCRTMALLGYPTDGAAYELRQLRRRGGEKRGLRDVPCELSFKLRRLDARFGRNGHVWAEYHFGED